MLYEVNTFQDTILTGTIIAFSLLTLFIAGQQQRARVDALTELSNREAFFNDINKLCQRKAQYRIIIIGLKNFKQVNGQFGQRAGDTLLYAVGSYLEHLDPRVAAYRFSGVQFMLLVNKKMRPEEYVITSYSIHYTKLYEFRLAPQWIFGLRMLLIGSTQMMRGHANVPLASLSSYRAREPNDRLPSPTRSQKATEVRSTLMNVALGRSAS